MKKEQPTLFAEDIQQDENPFKDSETLPEGVTEVEFEQPDLSTTAVELITKSGLEQTKGQKLLQLFTPYFTRMGEIEHKINGLNFDNPQPDDVKIARTIRLSLKDNRVASEKIKDEQKAGILIEARIIDNLNNLVKNTSKQLELKCELIEKFVEIQEAAKREQLRQSRTIELAGYEYQHDPNSLNLGDMSEDMYQMLLTGVKKKFDDKKELELKAEQERLEKQLQDQLHETRRQILKPFVQFYDTDTYLGKMPDGEFTIFLRSCSDAKAANDLEQERIRKENEALRIANEKKENELAKERERQAALKAKADAIKAELSKNNLYLERLNALTKIQTTLLSEFDIVFAFELTKKTSNSDFVDMFQHGSSMIVDEKNKAVQKEKDRIASEKKAAKQPDKIKLKAWVESFNCFDAPLLKEQESTNLQVDIVSKFSGFKKWALSEIEKL